MEPRIARIETHIEHLNANVAELRVAFVRVDAKIDDVHHRVDAKIDDIHHRLDAKIDAVEQRLDAKIASLGAKIDRVEHRLEVKIDQLAAKVDRHLLILGGMVVSLGIGMSGLMAKGFHWL